jgi:ribosomal silencing factor RsfS
MRDICVIEIPPEQQYARYLILATAFSSRHLKSTSEYINKLVRIYFKIKVQTKYILFSIKLKRNPVILF